MLSDSNVGAIIGAATTPAKEKSAAVEIDKEAAWKGEFRKTLEEVRDKGFRAYADEIRTDKLEEMRREILETMGLTEEDLAKMGPEQRAAIERAINMEIQKRLTAERTLDQDDPALAAAVAGGGALLDQPGSAPNVAVGLAIQQVIEAADRAESESEKNGKTG